MSAPRPTEALIEKLRSLPAEKLAEVEDFIDFLYQRDEDRHLVEAWTRVSQPAFSRAWDHPEDDVYDAL